MASNPTPENPDILRALADRLADGCHNLEVVIGIKHNTEAAMRAAIAAFSNAETQVGLKKAAITTAYDAVEAADEAGTVCLNNCKLRLRQVLGERWSTAWAPTGFPGNSTAVPSRQDQRLTLLDKLKNYFTAVPASESADMEATAALCEAAHTALSDARQAASDAETAQSAAMTVRDDALKALRKRVRGLIDELELLIPLDDPRWESFGLNIPANPSAPEGITSLTGTAQGGGKIHLVWTYATRMTGTRLRTKRAGIDEDFIPAGTADGLEKTLSGFDPGQTVEIIAIAYNDGGDAPPSPAATVEVV